MRRLIFLAVWLAVVTGCASTFPNWQPDRCHRGEPDRQTLNWDILCIKTYESP